MCSLHLLPITLYFRNLSSLNQCCPILTDYVYQSSINCIQHRHDHADAVSPSNLVVTSAILKPSSYNICKNTKLNVLQHICYVNNKLISPTVDYITSGWFSKCQYYDIELKWISTKIHHSRTSLTYISQYQTWYEMKEKNVLNLNGLELCSNKNFVPSSNQFIKTITKNITLNPWNIARFQKVCNQNNPPSGAFWNVIEEPVVINIWLFCKKCRKN